MTRTIKSYGLTALIIVGFASSFGTLTSNSLETRKFDNSNYVSRYKESTGSLYGYDDNNDGNLDRIEEVGIIPFKTGLPAFRIRQTHLPTDQNFSWYYQRISSLGESRSKK